MRVKQSLLDPLLFLSLASLSVAIECYSHNAVAASSSEFYNATSDGALIGCGTGPTTCCLEGQYCDVDLLCHDRSGGGVSRQYCSDPSWPSEACSAVCPQYPAAGIELTPCDSSGTKFCCGPSADDCCKAGNYTQINKNNGQIIAIGTTTLPTTSSAAASTSASTNSSATADTTATNAADNSGDGSANGGGLNRQGKLGVGLGVGLGVPFLIAVAAAIFFWHRSSARAAAAAAAAGGGAGMGEKPVIPHDGQPGPAGGVMHTGYFGPYPGPAGYVQSQTQLQELEANNPRAELGEETSRRLELDGRETRVHELQS